MFGLFGGKKQEAPKPKTLLQMNNDELKAAQKELKKGIRESLREVERQIFTCKSGNKRAEDALKKSVKKGDPKSVQRQYAQNLLKGRKMMDRQMMNKV